MEPAGVTGVSRGGVRVEMGSFWLRRDGGLGPGVFGSLFQRASVSSFCALQNLKLDFSSNGSSGSAASQSAGTRRSAVAPFVI